jgi:drug/metabolite transporter (DMT)-like permease
MAWLMFGESLSAVGLLGMAVAVAGVAFVVKK